MKRLLFTVALVIAFASPVAAAEADSATAYLSRADHLNDLSDRQRCANTGH